MDRMASSAGALDQAYGVYLTSAQAHIDQFKAAYQELSQVVFDAGNTIAAVDAGKFLLSGVTYLARFINQLGGLKTVLLGVIATLSTIKALNFSNAIQASATRLSSLSGNLVKARIDTALLEKQVMSLTEAERRQLVQQIQNNNELTNFQKQLALGRLEALGFNTNIEETAGTVNKLKGGLSNFGKGFSSMGLGGKLSYIVSIISIVASAVSVLSRIFGFDDELANLFKSTETRITEAKDKIDQINESVQSASNSFRSLRDEASNVIPRFVELAQGVTALGEKTERLTDEEYKEFLELNNKLADMFPELNAGMDENGNAMLTLAYTSDTLRESLDALLQKQKELTNYEISLKFPEQLENVVDQLDNYQDKIDDILDDNYEEKTKEVFDSILGGNRSFRVSPFNLTAFEKALKNLKQNYEYILGEEGNIIGISLIGEVDEAEIRSRFEDYQSVLNRQIKNVKLQTESAWGSFSPFFAAWVQDDDTFDQLDLYSRKIALALSKGLDMKELYDQGIRTEQQIRQYIKETILTPLNDAPQEVKDAFAGLSQAMEEYDEKKISYEELTDRIRELFSAVRSGLDDKAWQEFVSWMHALNIEGDATDDVIDGIVKAFAGAAPVLDEAAESAEKAIKNFKDLVSGIKSSYDILNKANQEMADGTGLSTDTLKSLADATDDYLDYLYEENGVIKLNTEAWKENADAATNARKRELEQALEVLKLAEEWNASTNGNVDYRKRPFISPERMKEFWPEFDGDIATTYTYIPDDPIGRAEAYYTVEVTPILEDGTILTKEEIDKYIETLITDDGIDSILASDKKNLVVQVVPGTEIYDLGPGETSEYWDAFEERVGDIKAAHWELVKQIQEENGVTWPEFCRELEITGESAQDVQTEIKLLTYLLDQMGESAEDNAAKLNDLQKAIKNVSDKAGGLETLGKMYEDVKNGGDFDFSSMISDDFIQKFSEYGDAYDTLMKTIADSPDNIGACQDAFNNLATEYVYGSGILDGLTEDYKQIYVLMLQHIGVANADAVVEAELARQKERVRLESIGVANKTYDEIIAMSKEQGVAQSTKQALADLARQKLLANQNSIKTTGDIQNLLNLAKAANATVASLKNLTAAREIQAKIDAIMSETSLNPAVRSLMIKPLKAALEKLLNQPIQFDPVTSVSYGGATNGYSAPSSGSGSSGGSSGSGSSSSSTPKAETWFEKEYKRHNHLRKMEQESDKTYFSWLDSAYKRAYQEGILTLDDYRKYAEEVFDGLRALFEDSLKDKEHQIWLLGGKTADKRDINQIIAYYKELMKAVAKESNKARAAGLTEESDYIQELQKKYRDYFDALTDARSNWFKELMDIRQFRIDKLVEHGGEPYKIVQLYQSMAEKIQKEVQWYLANGFSVSDEVVRDLIKQLWDVADNIVEAAGSAVDGIQNVYATLTNAAKEWAQTGYLSADSLQAILELGPKYLSFLYDENGQLKINEQALQKVLALRTEELAIDNAMVYAKRILAAAERKDGEELRALISVEAGQTASTWDMVYATLALARATGTANGMSEEYFDKAVDYIDKMRALTQTTIDTIAASYETLNEGYISQADALQAIIGYTKELIKYESEQQVDALNDELDAYKKIIDAKKESLRLSKEQEKHDRDVADKVAEIAALQAKIDQLALDDSREARAQRAKLEAELAEKQRALADSQADYAYDQQIEALDKSYEAFEAEKKAEIDALENMYMSEEALYQAAIERITNGWDGLYEQLIAWNTAYGSVLNDTITAAWDAAAAAAERYGDILRALEGVGLHTELGPGYGSGSGQNNSGPGSYHSGGVVGTSSAQQDEVLAVLKKGEIVLDRQRESTLYRVIDFVKYLSDKIGGAVNLNRISPSLRGLSIPGSGVSGSLAGVPVSVGEAAINTSVSVQINHTGPYSGEDAERFGKVIADSTINRINDAFSKRGITALGRATLKA